MRAEIQEAHITGLRRVRVDNRARDFAWAGDDARPRRKNTPGSDLPFDLGEPNLDLVQPRRIGGGKVNVDLGITRRELVDELRVL